MNEKYDHECGPTCKDDGCVCPCHDEREVASESREEKAARYIRESGKAVHSSDCATSLVPAEEPGPCDCDVT